MSILVCTNCSAVTPMEEILNSKKHRRGAICHACRNKKEREYRAKNSIKTMLSSMLARAKVRSNTSERGFSLTLKDLESKFVTHCPLLGLELDWSYGSNRKEYSNSPSLDRIDNSKGYTLENTWIISFKANTIKSNATPEEIVKMAKVFENLKLL